MQQAEMVSRIQEFLAANQNASIRDPQFQDRTQALATELTRELDERQREYQQNVAAANAAAAAGDGRGYEGSPPPEQVTRFGADRFSSNDQARPQTKDDLIEAFREVFSKGGYSRNNFLALLFLIDASFRDPQDLAKSVASEVPPALHLARGALLPGGVTQNPQPQQGNVAAYDFSGFEGSIVEFERSAVRSLAEIFASKGNGENLLENERFLALYSFIDLICRIRSDVAGFNQDREIGLFGKEIMIKLLECGEVEVARYVLQLFKKNAMGDVDEIHQALVESDETSSVLHKATDNVVLVADFIKDFGPSYVLNEEFEKMLTGCDFRNHADTPKRLLMQSNPASLAHFFEISGGLKKQENQNLLGSIRHFLEQPQNAEIRNSEACQDSLIWLLARYPSNDAVKEFEQFLDGSELQQVKKRQIPVLLAEFEKFVDQQYQDLGMKPQIEAAKFFKFLHGEEFKKIWHELSLTFQKSRDPNVPNSAPQIAMQTSEGGRPIDVSDDTMSAIFAKSIILEYRFDNSILGSRGEVLLTALSPNLEKLIPPLAIPAQRRPAPAAMIAGAGAAQAATGQTGALGH